MKKKDRGQFFSTLRQNTASPLKSQFMNTVKYIKPVLTSKKKKNLDVLRDCAGQLVFTLRHKI